MYAVLLVCVVAINGNYQLSFTAPFTKYDSTGTHFVCESDFLGQRYIDNWECRGDAVINEYFIRLTPDRQSKNGYCWSKKTFTNAEWVTTIKFRISGQV